ncbi:hypothetical protein [Treponema bryantii]|uniref:hypothetical protein n=1 Tax=Treponema bryantii TaxID=163 RepID=UPI002B30BF1B|nr:hypothetical protein TRBR_29850 [Treponema bryantii]
MEIYNLDNCAYSVKNGTFGGNSGDKEGILFNGDSWIVKYPKKGTGLKDVQMSYTQSPLSEYLGSHVYQILGYPVHETILGIRNNHLVVGCKDLCSKGETLIEFRQLKNAYNQTLSEKLDMSLSPTGDRHFTNFNEIAIHLKYNPLLRNVKGLNERFWDCIVIDGLINNNDRNSGNWGIIRSEKEDRVCPVFDNGASFSPNVPEYRIAAKLIDQNKFIKSACDGVTAYSLDGKNNARFVDLIKLDIEPLKKAIEKNVPLITEKMPEIQKMITEIPESFEGYTVMTKERKEAYKKELAARTQFILVPQYEKNHTTVSERTTDVQYEVSKGRKGRR